MAGDSITCTIHDKNLSTEISRKNVDAYGKKISINHNKQICRLRKWQALD